MGGDDSTTPGARERNWIVAGDSSASIGYSGAALHRTMRRLALIALFALLLGGRDPQAAPAGTLDQLAHDLDAKIDLALKERALKRCDLALALRGGPGATPRLVQAVRSLVIGKLALKGLRSVGELTAGQDARGRRKLASAKGYELLLDLELLIVEGHLHSRGELVAVDRSLWRDLHQPDRGALSHLHASVRVDAEVRAYLGSIAASSVRFSPRNVPLGKGEALALGAADVDGDGRTELLVLFPRMIQVLRQRGGSGGFTPVFSIKLAASLAAVRARRPLGALVAADLDGDGKVEVVARSGELERAVELVYDGKTLTSRKEIEGYPLATLPAAKGRGLVVGRVQPGLDLFSSLALAAGGAVPEWLRSPPSSFYALRVATVADKAGRRQYLGVVDGTGQLSLSLVEPAAPVAAGERQQPLLSARAGVAFDLVDLDDDGALEVVTSGTDGPDVEDQLAVYRLTRSNTLRLLWRSAGLGGQVVAVTHGDFDGNGKLEVVAAIRQRSGNVTLMVLN
jgi:hypothetical protein